MHKTLVYSFPFLLLIIEAGIRFLLNQNTVEFIGPTLCVAGLSFLVPLTKVKVKTIKSTQGKKSVTATIDDNEFVSFVLFAMLVSLILWGTSIVLATKYHLTLVGLPGHALIGAGTYGLSVVLTAMKERS